MARGGERREEGDVTFSGGDGFGGDGGGEEWEEKVEKLKK